MSDVREALMVGRNSEGKLIRRPLSPHMQVYKPEMSSVTSTFHRGTGIALGVGALLLAAWLVCAATSDGAFSAIQSLLASWVGIAILIGFTVALFYHFCNGIRHLLWDAGHGYDLPAMHRNGKIVFAATVVFTVVFWVVAFLVW